MQIHYSARPPGACQQEHEAKEPDKLDRQPQQAGPPETSQAAARQCDDDTRQEQDMAGAPLLDNAAPGREQAPISCIEAKEGGRGQPEQQPIPEQVGRESSGAGQHLYTGQGEE